MRALGFGFHLKHGVNEAGQTVVILSPIYKVQKLFHSLKITAEMHGGHSWLWSDSSTWPPKKQGKDLWMKCHYRKRYCFILSPAGSREVAKSR